MKNLENLFIEELFHQANYEFSKQHCKDILVVVHNQLEYTKKCVDTIYSSTDNFHLYIWDNGSDEETHNYLQEQQLNRKNFHFVRNDDNIGFIKPNNELATKLGASYYIDPATNKRVLTSHGLKLLEKCCEKKCSNCPFPSDPKHHSTILLMYTPDILDSQATQ
jgi:hypothetical protein